MAPRPGDAACSVGLIDAQAWATHAIGTHVGNILLKLHARDRTQAVITAYESGSIAL